MTKLYFHAALTSDTGTLPSTAQAALGAPAIHADAVTVNRSMDTTIGASQATLITTGTGTGTVNSYFSRFCSPPMNITSLASDTWNYVFAAEKSAGNITTPSSTTPNATVYVWRPSTGAKIATIIDGATSGFSQLSAATTEQSLAGTFSGASVSFASQDIICCEVYFAVLTRSGDTQQVFYDGTTETNTNLTTVSSQASHIESPNNTITFGGGVTTPIFLDWAPLTMIVEA